MVVDDLRKDGISPVYVLTDHIGFYEKYGFEFFYYVLGDGEKTIKNVYS